MKDQEIETYTKTTTFAVSKRYKTEKGEISLVEPCGITQNTFEIYCINGNLFEDVERYDSLEQAESSIKTYLL